MSPLDPEVEAILELLPPGRAGDSSVEEMRAGTERMAAELGGEPTALARVAAADADGVPVRVYEPEGAHGTVVYLHGGGWVTGALESTEPIARRLAQAAGARVVSVGYRLAPEHPFPAPLDDCATALRWTSATHGGPLAVAGDSAGANLAAVLARHARDGTAPPLAAQLLLYPVTDATRRDDVEGEGVLTRADMDWYWERYLGGHDPADPDVSPLRAPDLGGLAPAHVVLAAEDPLHGEGADYAQALQRAGVPVTLQTAPGTVHGFIRWLGHAAVARRTLDEAGAALREAFATR